MVMAFGALRSGYAAVVSADIEGALEVAQATFAYDLPWGLDTRIGENG